MELKKLIATSAIAIALVSTTTTAHADGGKLLGTLLGAAGGAALGSNVGKGKGRTVAIAVGTLFGAGIGNSVGKSVDRSNRGYYRKSTYRSYRAPSHYPAYSAYSPYMANTVYGQTDYVVPNYQNVGYTNTVTMVKQNVANQPYCREFTQSIHVGGKVQESYGKACRQPDGVWKMQNQQY